MINCPLCNNQNIHILETIRTNDIVRLYIQKLSIHIRELLKNFENLAYCQCPKCKLKFFNPAVLGDADFYSQLQQFDWYYLDEKFEFNIAQQHISSNDKVLEIGCGGGALSSFLPKTENYYGLDINLPKHLKSSPSFFQHSLKDHASQYAETYDVICYFHVLEHVDKIYDFIDQSLKCLRKKGKLLISVPSEDSFLKYTINNPLNMPPHHVSRWSNDSLKSIADIFNLKIINIHHEPLPEYHHQWAAKSIIYQQLKRYITKKTALIDYSFLHQILYGIAKIYVNFSCKSILEKKDLNGQASCFIFEK